jgi:hypothetical protein
MIECVDATRRNKFESEMPIRSRGQSVGCPLDNAKVERFVNAEVLLTPPSFPG